MSSGPRFSDDGLFYWDGASWVSALSPDGRHRWDGARWVPVHPLAAPPVAQPPVVLPPPRQGARRVATSWTVPLQWAVAGWHALLGGLTIAVALVVALHLGGWVDSFVRAEEAAHPADALPPPGFAAQMTLVVGLYLGAATLLLLAVFATAVLGAMKRWTWVYYFALAVVFVEGAGLAVAGVEIGGGTSPAGPANASRTALAAGAASAGLLLGWLLVAAVSRGPWGMTRASAGQQ